jgi:hypothetical protein
MDSVRVASIAEDIPKKFAKSGKFPLSDLERHASFAIRTSEII